MNYSAAIMMLGLALGKIISEVLRTGYPRWSLWLLLPPCLLLIGELNDVSTQTNQAPAIATSIFTLLNLGASFFLFYWGKGTVGMGRTFTLLFASYLCGIFSFAAHEHLAVSVALSAISLTMLLGLIPSKWPRSRSIRIACAFLLAGFWLQFHQSVSPVAMETSDFGFLSDLFFLASQITLLAILTTAFEGSEKYASRQTSSSLSFKSWVEINRILRTYQHDLRQPLSTINIVAGVGKAVSEKEETRQRFQHISAAHNSFTSMLEDFFEEVRSELLKSLLPDANSTVHATWCSLGQIFNALHDEYRYFAEAKGLSLRVKPTDLELFTDRVALEKILRNGLDNAIKYTSQGGIVMQVRRRWTTKNSGEALIQIQDTGTGIENDMTPASHKGWGYGSSIVHSLSRKIKGVVEVKNRPGHARGTCFSLKVPVCLPIDQSEKLAESLFVCIATNSTSESMWKKAEPAWFRERTLHAGSSESLQECLKSAPPRLGFIVCASNKNDVEEANLIAEKHKGLISPPLCITVALAPGLEQNVNPEEFPNLLFAETRLADDHYVIVNLENLVRQVEDLKMEAVLSN